MMVSAERDPRRAGTIWMLDLHPPTPAVSPLIEVTFSPIEADSTISLGAAMGSDSQAEICRRFETGRRCYGAWIDGKIAAYGWVSFNEEYVGELRLYLSLLPGEAYIWDCATLPEYRNQRLYSALLGFIVAELRAGPYCRAWIGANLDNEPSQRGIARAGFYHVADLLIQRVLAMRLVWVQGAPGAPNALVTEARRVFLGDRDRAWLRALEKRL